jgi:hypothetical protein
MLLLPVFRGQSCVEIHEPQIWWRVKGPSAGSRANTPYGSGDRECAEQDLNDLIENAAEGIHFIRNIQVTQAACNNGGSVHAESAGKGHGATFTVRLPIRIRDSFGWQHSY